jgi:hypothetical protein
MGKWNGLRGPITREMAESEPERERLFSQVRKPRPLPKTIDVRAVRETMKRTQQPQTAAKETSCH